MDTRLQQRIEAATGIRPERATGLSGGCVGTVMRIDLADGQAIVAKTGGPGLDIEGYMLRYLAERSSLPVPGVLLDEPDLLLIEHVESGGRLGKEGEEHAADLLAALHNIEQARYGLERDTLIGGLHQPNPPTEDWCAFFGEHRLVYMAREAERAGRLPADLRRRVEALAGRLEKLIGPPGPPSLIHGDVWGGNVLATPRGGRIAAFIDPAIYYADAEIELAFITLFGCFGDRFFDRYSEQRPIREGFFEVRKDLYNLYPLLVHVRLFGGGYVSSVSASLRQLEG